MRTMAIGALGAHGRAHEISGKQLQFLRLDEISPAIAAGARQRAGGAIE